MSLARRAEQQEDPGRALEAVAELRLHLDAVEAARVRDAVSKGWSWSRIATVLGVSRQAAHQKHGRRTEPAGPSDQPTGRLVVTGQARRMVRLARAEAAALGAAAVGPQHLLLGILAIGEGQAPRALRDAGVELAQARRAVAHLDRAEPGRPPVEAKSMKVSPEARDVFARSLGEAVSRGDPYLGVQHILLALLKQPAAPVARALDALGAPTGQLVSRLGAAGNA